MDTKIHTVSGAKLILDTLKHFGVDTIFGYPGGIVLKIYDEIYNQKEIKHILVRHEQSAVHAAEGYARATGKTGVVLVTSGPGATNTVTGIVNAYLDGFPLVIITGQVSSDLIGKNAFQEADICSITKSCTKKVYQVTDISNLQSTLNDAFLTANSGKKGPVVVDIAKNVFYQNTLTANYKDELPSEYYVSSNDIETIENMLRKSYFPLIVTGGGAVDAYNEIRKFSDKFGIPVVTTMQGVGTYPTVGKNYLGMIGIFGQKSANEALKKSDLILSLGARFNDRITCCFNNSELDNKIIQCDINSGENNKNFISKYIVNSDCKQIISSLNNSEMILKSVSWQNYIPAIKSLNDKNQKKSNCLHSFEILEVLNDFIINKNLYITTEVGQHQLWAVNGLDFKLPKHFITSGGSGTMGFGLPAAIGIAIADKSKPVICISGDGSFQMNFNELATCKDYDLPVKILLMNNGYLGMVRQLQENQCDGRYCETKISNPNFEKIAQSYGINYTKVTTKDEVLPALQKEFLNNNTSLIEFIIEPMEVV